MITCIFGLAGIAALRVGLRVRKRNGMRVLGLLDSGSRTREPCCW
jgi:hypothetical protein